jgi:hypothetical protein
VDPAVIAALGISPTGSVSVHTPTTGATPHAMDQYDVAILVPSVQGQLPLYFPTIPVVETNLSAQGIQALFGRDMLSRCFLHYNGTIGPTGVFTLAF